VDANGDGSISLTELKSSLKGSASREKIYDMLQAADTDGSGEIDYTEFLAATIDPKIFMREDYLKTAFNMFDKDGSGKIDAKEIAILLKGRDYNLKKNNNSEVLC
jgi:calcium-dependent protein kinase